MNLSAILYGFGGSGKTYTALTSFCDPLTGELTSNGRWIRFGAESNPAVLVPPGHIYQFSTHKEFASYMLAALGEIKKGVEIGPWVFDGYSEWALLYLHDHEGEDNMTQYKGLKDAFVAITRLTSPVALGSTVIWTARIDKKRDDIVNKKGEVFVEGDPDFLPSEYYPGISGRWTKFNMPNYANLVLHCDTLMTKQTRVGKLVEVPTHRVHLVSGNDYFVKNCWEHRLLATGHPGYLDNPTWSQIMQALEGKDGG